MSHFRKPWRDTEHEARQPRRFHSFPILVILFIALGLWGMSKARSEQFSATGAFCGTKESATSFVSQWDGSNAEEVVEIVNKEAGTQTCILATVLLEEVGRYDNLTTSTGVWQLVEVKVFALSTLGMSIHFPDPVTHFTYIQVVEVGQAI